jgi:hypothetical protein
MSAGVSAVYGGAADETRAVDDIFAMVSSYSDHAAVDKAVRSCHTL